MKTFFKTFFASMLGAGFATALCLFLILVSITSAIFFSTSEIKKPADSPILKINLSGIINEREFYDPWQLLLFKDRINNQGLNNILKSIKNATEDNRVKGIYLSAGFAQIGFSAMQEIRNALKDFKKSGKFIVAYGEVISQKTYYMASVADKIILNPLGMLDFKGLGSMQQYHKGIFDKMGVEIQTFKVGTYKSYIEPYTQNSMSDNDREQKSTYLNLLWKNMLNGISESRDIPKDSLNLYADEYLLFSAPENLIKYNLIDSLAYKSDFETSLKEMVGIEDEDELKFLKTSDLLEDFAPASKDKIAILYAEGSIVSDAEENLYSNSVITAKTYIKAIKNLQKDSSVKAVVFRINSGGGSAYASEQIWHEIKKLSKIKPVVASLGSYAASGGYYIACAANKIVSSPNSITGSIGIFGMFPSGEKLANKMGAFYDGVGTNKNTLFGSEILSLPFLNFGFLPARSLNEEEFAMLQNYVEIGYNTFLSRCAEGRNISTKSLDSVAQGRVWLGLQAVDINLADTLGGIETAVETAANLAGIEDYSTEEYPKAKDRVEEILDGLLNQTKAKTAEFVLGKEAYKTKLLLNALNNHDYRQAVFLY